MASVFAKFAGLAGNTKDTFFYIALQFMSLAIYALIWQVVLKSMPLATAYANKAICVVWSYVFGVILFGEHITIGKAIGVALVVAGILLVVSDDE